MRKMHTPCPGFATTTVYGGAAAPPELDSIVEALLPYHPITGVLLRPYENPRVQGTFGIIPLFDGLEG